MLERVVDQHRQARRREDWRRYRARVRRGQRIAFAPYDGEIVHYLIKLRWLREEDADDSRAIGEAYYRAIKDSAPS